MYKTLRCFLLLTALCGGYHSRAASEETPALTLTAPVPYQIVQRQDYNPALAHIHGSESAMGHGAVPVRFTSAPPAGARLEYRAVPLKNAFGTGIEWTALKISGGGKNSAMADVPAGGWYRFEVRAVEGSAVRAAGSVEPVGVGELFLIAGQSYADNCNDEQLRVQDPEGRVAVCDPGTGEWRIAHDPLPTPSSYRAGTLWPAFGDLLVPLARVPIGFVNVAFAATASAQWLPGTPLFKNLIEGGKALGTFRAVLWQQGESDVLGRVDADTYVLNLVTIRTAAVKEWGCEPAWLPAKSTFHPTVYNEPEAEGIIRSAIARLWTMDGFGPGPDTDILGGENRGDINSQRHFSPIGQRRAALMWLCAVWNEMNHAGENK